MDENSVLATAASSSIHISQDDSISRLSCFPCLISSFTHSSDYSLFTTLINDSLIIVSTLMPIKNVKSVTALRADITSQRQQQKAPQIRQTILVLSSSPALMSFVVICQLLTTSLSNSITTGNKFSQLQESTVAYIIQTAEQYVYKYSLSTI